MAKKNIDSNTNTNKEKSESKVGKSQSKILKNLAFKLSDDYHPVKNLSKNDSVPQKDAEIQKINKMINDSAKKLSNKSGSKKDKKKTDKETSLTPPDFNGVSDSKEKNLLFQEKIKHLERENTKLKYKLELLHDDFQKEKTNLKKSVRELKGELRRTAPLTDAKIFSFSKELKEVISAVESFSSDSTVVLDNTKSDDSHLDTISPSVVLDSPTSVTQGVESIDKPRQVTSQNQEGVDKSESEEKKSIKKKKTVVASTAIAAALIVVVSGVALSRQPEINQEVVDSYLEQDGEVQGSSDDILDQDPPVPSLIKKEEKNNVVTYDETVWEVYRDEFLGFQVKYPDNVTDLLHTGNTTTFLRKDGYLFKMQRISTQRTLDEYWEYIKDDGLKYEIEPTTISFFKALHLVLMEDIEFPGNRYLVEGKGHLYDIWYAVPNKHFDDDDMKRVDFMVESLRFL